MSWNKFPDFLIPDYLIPVKLNGQCTLQYCLDHLPITWYLIPDYLIPVMITLSK